jgi:hypothetical protein
VVRGGTVKVKTTLPEQRARAKELQTEVAALVSSLADQMLAGEVQRALYGMGRGKTKTKQVQVTDADGQVQMATVFTLTNQADVGGVGAAGHTAARADRDSEKTTTMAQVRIFVLPGGKVQVFVDKGEDEVSDPSFEEAQAITAKVLNHLQACGVEVKQQGEVESHRVGVGHVHVLQHAYH